MVTAITRPTTPGQALADVIKSTAARSGKLVIPAFAIGRVEELLYWVRRLEAEHRIPVLPVYVDSPMATEALRYYSARVAELDPELRPTSGQVYAFATTRFQTVASTQQSKELTASRRPAVVISSSGMATGGRVLHHLAAALPDQRNTVLFVGYQAAGTRGRQLVDGAREVRIHGRSIPVNATSRKDRFDVGARRSRRNSQVARNIGVGSPAAVSRARRARADGCAEGTDTQATCHGRRIHLRMERRLNSERRYLLEHIDDAAVVQLYADGFAGLALGEKVLIWHLYLAALAGRDIYYDQRHAQSLEMRVVLEAILTHGLAIAPEVLQEIRRYTKLFWINSGPYNNVTARKFVLRLTQPELLEAALGAAGAGATLPTRAGESVERLIDGWRQCFWTLQWTRR